MLFYYYIFLVQKWYSKVFNWLFTLSTISLKFQLIVYTFSWLFTLLADYLRLQLIVYTFSWLFTISADCLQFSSDCLHFHMFIFSGCSLPNGWNWSPYWHHYFCWRPRRDHRTIYLCFKVLLLLKLKKMKNRKTTF